MSGRDKRLLWILAFLPIPLVAAAIVLGALLVEQGKPVPLAVTIPASLALLLWAIGVGWGVVQIAGRKDMTARERTVWTVALPVFFPVTLPLYWWNLVRPLPEDPAQARAEEAVAPSSGARKDSIGVLEWGLVYWLLGIPLLLFLGVLVLVGLHQAGVVG